MKLTNWKTTVAGIIAGLIPIAQTLAATLQTGAAINWTQIALGVFIMVLGVVAKDFNTTAIALVIALPLLQGCSMSLEQARADGIAKRAKANPAVAVSRTECNTLDSLQRYWGYAGYATGPVGPAAGAIAAIPGVTGKTQDALLVTAGVAAAVTVFEFAEQGNFSQQWVEQGCGQ